MENKYLIVVDMQNDFITGSLGTKEAQAIVPAVVEKINNWEGTVIATRDTHYSDYSTTREGRHLPVPHCINHTPGWEIESSVAEALKKKDAIIIDKTTFGTFQLIDTISRVDLANGNYDSEIEVIGLCTDICVVSNALLLKNAFQERDVSVDAACCAGVTPDTHAAALKTMMMCQIDVKNN